MKIEEPSYLVECVNSNSLEDADQALLETFEVPVLVDAGVNDSRVEHLLSFLSEQVA